ncbi:hypothetical protein ALC60_01637 [Trachymyrmex zeteki]|uniref:Uncharacterized protein n=1 Tax=Mycetomoellerius zeteki TaxID=64791 RepID=A0A151XG49_9HYME|nr:hypothetical protein ALC60_01637 [Trachymyrmex zeteki]
MLKPHVPALQTRERTHAPENVRGKWRSLNNAGKASPGASHATGICSYMSKTSVHISPYLISEHLILTCQSNLKLVLIDIFPPTIYEITTSICYFAFHKSPLQKNGTLAILHQILVDKTICKEELHTCIVYVLASILDRRIGASSRKQKQIDCKNLILYSPA